MKCKYTVVQIFKKSSLANIYMFKVNKRKTIDVVDVVLVFLLLKLNLFQTFFSSVSIVEFEQVNVSWVTSDGCFRNFIMNSVSLHHYVSTKIFKKQPFTDVLQNRCSYKFRKIHNKRSVPLPVLLFCEFFFLSYRTRPCDCF